MCFGGNSISSARGTEAYQRHRELGKAITRRRQELRRKGFDNVRKAYFDAMPASEINKQIDAMMGLESGDLDSVEFEDDWTPTIPSFSFPEHEFVAEAFFGPTSETLTGAEALSRQIKVIHNLVRLCDLRERPKHGPRGDWSVFEEEIKSDGPTSDTPDPSDEVKLEESPPADNLAFPTDEGMWCVANHGFRVFCPRKKQRPDSLRRHIENQHLNRFSLTESVACPHEVCKETGVVLPDRVVWLNHAATVHKYDLKVQLHRLSGG